MLAMREMSSSARFRDRRDAGRQLGDLVAQLRVERPTVLGLARGGVPVAFEVARALAGPLDVLVVRKLGVPNHDELAFGAVGEDETQVLNIEMIQRLGLSRKRVARVIERERVELIRRVDRYRVGRAPLGLARRTAIVVDDGLATGATARVAVAIARTRDAGRVIVAVPTAPRETIAELSRLDIEVFSLQVPPAFRSVGEWYEDFTQTSDDEVASLLHQTNPETGNYRE
jgi:putative phosphoribosyl transferase